MRPSRPVLWTALILCGLFLRPGSSPARPGPETPEVRTSRIKKCIQLLGHKSVLMQIKGTDILGEIGDDTAHQPLINMLSSDNRALRTHAVTALGRLRAPKAAGPLLDLLKKVLGGPEKNEVELQIQILWALGEIGPPSDAPEIFKCVQALNHLWVEAAVALGKIAHPKGLSAILEIFKRTKDPVEQSRVAGAVGRMDPARGYTMLKDLYKNPDFHNRFAALQGLGEVDTLEAAEFMLNVLQQEHDKYTKEPLRDAAALAIARLRKPPTIKRVMDWGLRQSKPEVRALVARALGDISDPMVLETLKRFAAEKEPEIRAAALTALGKRGNAETRDLIERYINDDDLAVSVAATEALGGIGTPECLAALLHQLGRKDPRVQRAAAQALCTMRAKEGVEPVMKQLLAAGDWLKWELSAILQSMTGKDYGLDAAAWLKWWETGKNGFVVPYPEDVEEVEGQTKYYGIELRTDKALFILDVSGSMGERSREYHAILTGIEGKTGNDDPLTAVERANLTKIRVAQRQLVSTIRGLKPTVKFGITVFANDPTSWQKDLVPATDPNKKSAVDYINRTRPTTGTNICDTLTKALELAGPGVTDPAKPIKLDTIFFLSDGTPTVGSFTDLEPILKRIRTMNPFGRVRIHAIGVGEHNARLMQRLAAENGGRFVDRNKESW